MGCHFLLLGIFPTQRSNPCLLLIRQVFFTTEPPGKLPSSYIPIVFYSGLSNHTTVLGDTVSAHKDRAGAIAVILGEMAYVLQELLCLNPSFKCHHEAGRVETEKFLENEAQVQISRKQGLQDVTYGLDILFVLWGHVKRSQSIADAEEVSLRLHSPTL